MESGSDSMGDENQNRKRNSEINNGNSKLNKPKRQMKTPFQLETLEQAYQAESYPSESVRAELSEKLGLSDRQLQTWFCHRRLKDKKEGGSGSGGPAPAIKHRRSMSSALPEPRLDDVAHVSGEEPESDYGSCSGSGSSGFGRSERNVMVSRGVVKPRRRHYEPPGQSVMELRAIAIVEAQLGEPLREDGPVVGVYFDEVPQDAFMEPLVAEQKWHDAKPIKGTSRSLHEYPYVEDHRFRPEVYGQVAQSYFYDSVSDGLTARTSPFASGNEQFLRVHGVPRRDHIQSKQDRQAVVVSSPDDDDDDDLPQREPFINSRMYTQYSEPPTTVSENYDESSDGQINDTVLRMERKRKSEQVRMPKEVEADEVQIRKEKQNVLWRKNEERMRKQMERPDRERQKEKGRSKEQRREIEQKEKYFQKENIRI